jgi:hypothetical protein
MKKTLGFLILCGLIGCGDAGTEGGRIVLYSTSPGFQPVSPVSQDTSAGPPLPSELPEPSPDEESPEAPLPDEGADPFADRVVSYQIGEGGGLNEDGLPDIVLGAPRGGGLYQGSFHVLSLGVGGEIIVEMTDFIVVDGEGDDFTVFENAFQVASGSDDTFAEPGVVGVSEDGVDFVDFPCDTARPYAGCAGIHPVLANADLNDIDPADPSVSGGDSFDLRDVGLASARFVSIRDSGLGLGPIGPGTRGFDLDSVAIIHGTLP